ncbi:uncharacterized protein B0H18DRAFT_1044243 [Fomitopsis serialis]|uniref:uncharacterized protein n=1 Tax=Fomitopsis serialis TaxID=139415 RepID=UPI00200778F1|nr:uncharacterized protein B0H18DRAFT_1044243 [Neoantrodia serialis]KAH9914690.1 hypothetical protein B0H18DRAFT_1044243 [Neoantrodia serialis]
MPLLPQPPSTRSTRARPQAQQHGAHARSQTPWQRPSAQTQPTKTPWAWAQRRTHGRREPRADGADG